jgi:hypothetical protein
MKDLKEKILSLVLVVLAWLIALSLLYIVISKFKFLLRR